MHTYMYILREREPLVRNQARRKKAEEEAEARRKEAEEEARRKDSITDIMMINMIIALIITTIYH